MTFHLVLGGVKSGKSRFAQELAERLSARPLYVATSRVWDDDHRRRIQRHQRDRPTCFETIECDRALSNTPLEGRVAVIDCVTLWLANYSFDEEGNVERCLELAKQELNQLAQLNATLIFVSNELGHGVHPESALARKFVDLQGIINQDLASRSTCTWLLHAGIAVPIKGQQEALRLGASEHGSHSR